MIRESNSAYPQPKLDFGELRNLAQDGFAHIILPVMGMSGEIQVEHPDFRMLIPQGSVPLYQAIGCVVAKVQDLLDVEINYWQSASSIPAMKRAISQ